MEITKQMIKFLKKNYDKEANAKQNKFRGRTLLSPVTPSFEKAIQPTNSSKLEPKGNDEKVYWPTEEESPPTKSTQIQEETFSEK